MSMRYKGGVISATPPTTTGGSFGTAPGIWTLEQQMQAQKSSTWPLGYDPQFNYVTMLLHGDGTNGGQNNTFLDSSTNNFTITRNGNTTQGTFSPYGSNWSVNNGAANGNGFQFSGTTLASDFTMEAWVFATPHPSTQSIVFSYSSGNVQMIYFYPDGRFGWYRSSGSGVTAAGVFTYNTWNHVAAVRSSGVIKLYLNGVDVGISISDGSSVAVDSLLGYGGSGATTYNVLGYVSNARVTNTAVYSGNFIPSTAPLTAISGTQLLTFQSNNFKDNSTNNFAFTIAGTPSVQRFSPFAPTAAYSTATIGGSGYFDGSGDYLQPSSTNSAFNMGTGDWTIEAWIYPTVSAGVNTIYAWRSDANMLFGSNTLYFYDGTFRDAGIFIPLYAWTHVAWVRQSGTVKPYVNGVAGTSFTNTSNMDASYAPYIGNSQYSEFFDGWMTDLRVVKGTAVYTTGFTPPTAPLTAVSGTSLLLNYTNGLIYDNAMMNDLETVGNAQISTSVKKYGTGSIYLDGTGDYLIGQSSPNMSPVAGAFTMECWIYMTSAGSGNKGILTVGNANSTGNALQFVQNGTTLYINNGSGTNTSIGTISLNTWTHIALVREGTGTNQAYGFINGVKGTTTTYSSTFSSPMSVKVGTTEYGSSTNSEQFTGYIDDIRITKGYARYTANFTPPSGPFFNTGS